ncbi:hypothetical protein Bca4012_037224 [Brassica carinata]|uniref:Uncharacterized protein n=1 Tax=Brassica carinata TaxID=52824 RepID=A0A8X7WCJ6_BRACI|nr:hypothetical protein Bca52824_010912 [Brassica carinata]
MNEVENTGEKIGRDVGEINTEKDGDKVDLEGELNEWKTVLGEKKERSPKTNNQKFKEGQVSITTPSRFDASRNTK